MGTMPRILITGLPNRLQGSNKLRRLVIETIPNAVEQTPGFSIAARDVDVRAVADMIDSEDDAFTRRSAAAPR